MLKSGLLRLAPLVFLFAGVLIPVFAAPVVSVSGLIGFWRLDETATDAVDDSGNGNDGVWTGTVAGVNTVPAAGPPGVALPNANCASFNGTTGYIEVGAPAVLNVTTAITVAAWLNIASTTAEKKAVARWSDTPAAYSWLLSVAQPANNEPIFAVQTGIMNIKQSGVTLTPGTWYHVVATYDGAAMNMYVNGAVAGMPAAATGAIVVSTAPVRIGAGGGTAAEQPFDGRIDDVRIYDRALSGAEVTTLYNGVLPGAFTLTATSAITQNDLSWTASTGAVSYSVQRGTAPGGPYTPLTTTAGTTYFDTTAVVGTPYFYVIVASNVVGDQTTPEQTATSLPVPPKTNKSGSNNNIGHRCGCDSIGLSGGTAAAALAAALLFLLVRRR